MQQPVEISLSVNGVPHRRAVEPRLLLSDFLRHELRLTGTHVGCEHGVCGACTVLVDGLPARACLVFAVQAEGRDVRTVESLSPDGRLSDLQQSFVDHHGLQCGFCTPGFLTTIAAGLDARDPTVEITDEEVDELVGGNLCRCTGYQNIVEAVALAAERMGGGADAASPAERVIGS